MSDSAPKSALTGFEGTFGDLTSDRSGAGSSGGPGGRSDSPRPTLRTTLPSAPPPRPAAASFAAPEAPAARGVQDIFLSPRVVDRQAFNDFSQSLRELIDQAAAGTEALRRSALEAEQAKASLKELIATQQMKLEQSTKMIALVDQKAQQTRKLIEGAGDPTARIEELRSRTDTLVQDRLAQLAQRVEDAVTAADARISSVSDRLAPLMKEADRRIATLNGQLDAELAPSIAGLQHLCDRADVIIGRGGPDGTSAGGLNDLVVRAERTKDEAAFALRQLDSVREQAEQARRMLGEAVTASLPLIDEVASVQGHLESTVARATELGRTTQADIVKELATHRDTVAQAIGQLGADSDRLAAQLTEAIDSAHQARRAATQAAGTGEEAAGHLTRLLDRLEPWHGVLLAPAGPENLPLPLRDVLNAVRVELKRDLAGVASALRAVAERTEHVLETQESLPDVLSETKSVTAGDAPSLLIGSAPEGARSDFAA